MRSFRKSFSRKSTSTPDKADAPGTASPGNSVPSSPAVPASPGPADAISAAISQQSPAAAKPASPRASLLSSDSPRATPPPTLLESPRADTEDSIAEMASEESALLKMRRRLREAEASHDNLKSRFEEETSALQESLASALQETTDDRVAELKAKLSAAETKLAVVTRSPPQSSARSPPASPSRRIGLGAQNRTQSFARGGRTPSSGGALLPASMGDAVVRREVGVQADRPLVSHAIVSTHAKQVPANVLKQLQLAQKANGIPRRPSWVRELPPLPRPLVELIGPSPSGRSWRDEWLPLLSEYYWLSGQGWAANEAHLRQHEGVEQVKRRVQPAVDALVVNGWPRERAEACELLLACTNAMSRALRESDGRYAASSHALAGALVAQRREASRAQPPRPLYAHRVGLHSLAEDEPAWGTLEDANGRREITSMAATRANRLAWSFGAAGCAAFVDSETGFESQDSDVVCFESMPDDELGGAHAAIPTRSAEVGVFPPNTTFRLREVIDAGEWEAPGGAYPRQRLLVVSATYRLVP